MKIEGLEPCGNCPVQAWGWVDEYAAYFRARGDHWSFEIGPPEFPYDACTGFPPSPDEKRLVYSREGSWGTWPDAGWMSEGDARRLIRDCLLEYEGFPWPREAPSRMEEWLRARRLPLLVWTMRARSERRWLRFAFGWLAQHAVDWALRSMADVRGAA